MRQSYFIAPSFYLPFVRARQKAPPGNRKGIPDLMIQSLSNFNRLDFDFNSYKRSGLFPVLFPFVSKNSVKQHKTKQHVHHHKAIYKIVVENFAEINLGEVYG